MSDPWAVHDDNGAYFGDSLVKFEERISKEGNPYKAFIFTLTPLNPELQIKEYMQFPNDVAMQQVIVPSLMKLISDGKITSPSDMEKKQFVKWREGEYKSRSKKDISYWNEHNADRVGTDPHGNYVIKRAVEYLDIYPSLEACQQAYNEIVQQIELPATEPPQPLKDSLVTLIGHHFPNLAALQESVLSKEQYSQFFSLQDDFVRGEVANLIIVKAGNDETKQQEWLDQVNGHFNGDTPYLTKEDLPEIAFS